MAVFTPIILILKIKKPRHSEIKQPAQDNLILKWQSPDLSPGEPFPLNYQLLEVTGLACLVHRCMLGTEHSTWYTGGTQSTLINE